jgi:hypothetical protein
VGKVGRRVKVVKEARSLLMAWMNKQLMSLFGLFSCLFFRVVN